MVKVGERVGRTRAIIGRSGGRKSLQAARAGKVNRRNNTMPPLGPQLSGEKVAQCSSSLTQGQLNTVDGGTPTQHGYPPTPRRTQEPLASTYEERAHVCESHCGHRKRRAGNTQSVERKLDFSIVPMDDFKMVLGMEFFDQVHAFPLSATNSLSILDGSMAFMVPAECSKIADKTLSTMQFKKSFRKDPSFLVSIWELNDGEDRSESPSQVPPLIQGVLNEFKDVMPPELPKKLLPRREVDHEIELEQGVKPPALAPYWMAPPELEELRRHL
ncbi:hypothetical protein KPL70_021689 [Citrus sinensis]|nr:hypothetical protein KPL70_021689 [Citrus sinensis]